MGAMAARVRRTVAHIGVALLACGVAACGAAAPRPRPVVGNDAVRERLAPLPELPVDPTLEVRAAELEELRTYCAWQARAVGGYDVEASCPDGGTVRIAAACADDDLRAMREGLSACPMTIGEWAACVAARRASPCEGGVFGERLAECEAFAGCITAALQEGATDEAP